MIPPGNYLVAGSAGLMGTTSLLRMGRRGGVIVRSAYHNVMPTIKTDNIFHVQSDLTNLSDCKKIVEGIDVVFMFAGILSTAPVLAKDPIAHINRNLVMNANMLEAAYFAGVKKFVWIGSTTGFPEQDDPLCEEDILEGEPPNHYFAVGWMSRYTEILCRTYAQKLPRSMTTIVLRPTTIYGEYETFDVERSHVLPALVKRIVDRERPVQIWGNAQVTRDLIYCDDVFDACILALEKSEGFVSYNIGLGKEYSLLEIANIIDTIDHYVDIELDWDDSKPSSIKGRKISFERAHQELGFFPKTTLEGGITKVVSAYKQREKYA